ncbi:hypothetical protein RRF57_003632 [Xylaria bambusicola]|uniref:Uncharacterized protein n=1 Tax=Xylaria bambusicola TaxID=326684 RepID=A0AAN7Z304_9PEZI
MRGSLPSIGTSHRNSLKTLRVIDLYYYCAKDVNPDGEQSPQCVKSREGQSSYRFQKQQQKQQFMARMTDAATAARE